MHEYHDTLHVNLANLNVLAVMAVATLERQRGRQRGLGYQMSLCSAEFNWLRLRWWSAGHVLVVTRAL